MNYEQRYKDALERARDMMSYKEVRREDMEYLFPELKEPEDEGIRESIAGFLKTISSLKDGQTVSNEDFDTKVILEWVAWLEQQGEQIDIANKEYWRGYREGMKVILDKYSELEKQGEQKSTWSKDDELMLKDAIEFIENGWSDRGKSHLVYWLKSLKERAQPKQGEQKSVDKVEPRFKVGDFIVNDYCRGKVVELTNDAYLLDTGQGIPFSCEHNIHLWDITKDAKDGDVLCTYE